MVYQPTRSGLESNTNRIAEKADHDPNGHPLTHEGTDTVEYLSIKEDRHNGPLIVWMRMSWSQADEFAVQVRLNDTNQTQLFLDKYPNPQNTIEESYSITSLTPGTSYQIWVYYLKNGVYSGGWGWSDYIPPDVLTIPTLSTSNISFRPGRADITVSSSYSKLYLEYEQVSDSPEISGYSRSEREHFFYTACEDSEGYNDLEGSDTYWTNIHRFRPGTIDVKIYMESTMSSSSRSQWESWITDAINQINSANPQGITVVKMSGITLVSPGGTSTPVGDINVFIGTDTSCAAFAGTSFPSDTYGKNIRSTDAEGYISIAYALAATNRDSRRFHHVILEEIVQCLGASNDNDYDATSIHYDIATSSVTQLNNKDRAAIRLLHEPGLPINAPKMRVGNILSVPVMLRRDGSGSRMFNIDYLKPVTQYRARVWASRNDWFDGYSNKSSWVYFTTPDLTVQPPTLELRYEGGFRIDWPDYPGADGYVLRLRRGYDNDTQTFSMSATVSGRSIFGLQYGVTYYVSLQVRYGPGDSTPFSAENPATTAPKSPTMTTGTIDTTSIQLNISGMEGNYDQIIVDRYTDASVYIDSKTLTSNGSVKWTGLTAGTYYRFIARSTFFINNTTLTSVNSPSLRIRVGGARPANFDWQYSTVTSGSNARVDHRDWNNLCARINEFRIYRNLSTYTFTTVSASTGDITAVLFNQLVNGVQDLAPHMTNNILPSANKVRGDDFYASYLNNIITSINSIL